MGRILHQRVSQTDGDNEIDNWFFVKEQEFTLPPPPGGQPFNPLLACRGADNTFTTLRSAREHIAYINLGPGLGGALTLQHHCLDAGDGRDFALTKHQIVPPPNSPPGTILGSQAALFTQWAAEVTGPWGDSLFLWSKADFAGFRIEPSTAPPEEKARFCANARPNGGGAANPSYPALRWSEAINQFWAKRPKLGRSSEPALAFVDIDGDGYVDRLGDLPGTERGLQAARVMFTRRLSAVETEELHDGPALVPFSADATGLAGRPVPRARKARHERGVRRHQR